MKVVISQFSLFNYFNHDTENVGQLPQKWSRCWKRVTIPQIAEQFLNLWNNSPKSNILFQDVEQYATFNCVSYRSGLSHRLSFRIIVMHLVLCKFMVENYWLIFSRVYRVARRFKIFNLAICSTICGTEIRLQDLFHFLGGCSTNCGTAPQKVELFHFLSAFLNTANNCIYLHSATPHAINAVITLYAVMR